MKAQQKANLLFLRKILLEEKIKNVDIKYNSPKGLFIYQQADLEPFSEHELQQLGDVGLITRGAQHRETLRREYEKS